MNTTDKFSFYKEHPKTCEPDDFWGQVMRTVNGRPVGEEQIRMIIDSIKSALDIVETDVLLDLCCGNGALTDRLFKLCRGGLGVDFSEPLIEIAHRYFQSLPYRKYELWDVEDFLRNTSGTGWFTKCLCYGSFMYLPEEKAVGVLQLINSRFERIERLFIGNIPDKTKLGVYCSEKKLKHMATDDPASPIGIWRTRDEFEKLSNANGWNVSFTEMPDSFYSSGYRYDALLFRKRA